MTRRQPAPRRVTLGPDGLIHVRTRPYRDDLLIAQWEELVMTPAEAADFFAAGMNDVHALCPHIRAGRTPRRVPS